MRSRVVQTMATMVLLVITLVSVLACTRTEQAATPEQFYRGSTLTWVVSSDAGSGSDLNSRVLAQFLAKELGATVKVENQGPDEGLNYVYTEAKKDGLTVVMKNTDAIIGNDILKAPGVLYETDKFNFVAGTSPSTKVFQASPKLGIRTLDELRKVKKEFKGGASTAKGAFTVNGAVTLEILGLNGKMITGYEGRKGVVMAVSRGEVDFLVASDEGAMRDERDGFVVSTFIINKDRSRILPDLPTIFELGVTVPKEMEAAHEYILASGYGIALPPEAPQDRVDYLRQAFVKFSDDKDFQAEMEKLNGYWSPIVTGKQLQDKMAAMKANKELRSQLDTISAKYSAVR
ncbi:MAG: hypothetical protein HYY30_14275 [Chloroflexi bacterium]|nr:hypothetical protein [Chloroflexota bacterium]